MDLKLHSHLLRYPGCKDWRRHNHSRQFVRMGYLRIVDIRRKT